MKAAFFEVEPWEEKYLRSRLENFELFFSPNKIEQTTENFSDCEIASVFIYSKIDQANVAKFKNLKFVSTRSTGFDHINIEVCRQNGIKVANVPTYGENTVAEHTFALILDLSRRISASLERTKRGDFSVDNLRGFDLKGKTLGIVGTGNIGKNVARIGKGFQMKLLGYDINQDENMAREFGLSYVSLEELLKNSDIITLHLPYNKSTHHIINMQTLGSIKKGSVLINTARGGLCESAALLKGLEEKVFSGIGLDVLEEECFIKEEREILTASFSQNCDLKAALANHILLNHPNVIITPHIAFDSEEALRRILDTTIENIQAFVSGKPVNLVL